MKLDCVRSGEFSGKRPISPAERAQAAITLIASKVILTIGGRLGCVRRREEQIGVAATRLNTTEQRVDAVVPHQPQPIAG